MIRTLSLALLLAGAAPVFAHEDSPAPAGVATRTPAEIAATLSKPPADAQRYVIASLSAKHGSYARWNDKDGTQHGRFSLLLRGFYDETEVTVKRAADGAIIAYSAKGESTNGPATESFSIADGKYRFSSVVGNGEGAAPPGAVYLAYASEYETSFALLEALLKSPTKSVALLPGGRATIEPLTSATVTANGQSKSLTAYAITGLGYGPSPVWTENGKPFGFVGFLSTLPEGWEGVAPELSKIQNDALAKRAATLAKSLASPVETPIAFTDVRVYDAEGGSFREGMTVVASDGRIAAVGPAASTKVPANAVVKAGAGKTLLPGLWDNHQHFGDDSSGILLLSMGVLNIRDPGNKPEESIARKKRIEAGEILGPGIVPMMLIDGKGPNSAQMAVFAENEAEAIAAVDKAKAMGFAGVKLYGTLKPALVKPIADRAHALGMRVQGHVPQGMRPLDAVRAGYDELTHINFTAMQFMPQEIIDTNNGLNRFYGPAKYMKDVDLGGAEAKAFFDELVQRKTAIDPTLAIFEGGFSETRGTLGAAYRPYEGIVPPSVERYYRDQAFAERPDVSRETMRASFAKLKQLVAELNKRGVPVLAGTDGNGFELIRDLELYVEGGMTPAQALATATIIPARTFGWAKDTGSIAVGKKAELVLVDGDPSKNIGDVRHVEWVVQGNKLMDAAKLRAAVGISGMPK